MINMTPVIDKNKDGQITIDGRTIEEHLALPMSEKPFLGIKAMNKIISWQMSRKKKNNI